MAQFKRSVFHLHIILAGLLLLLWPLAAAAQSGCTGDPCVFSTPTATPSPTAQPTAGPGTPQPTPIVDMPPSVEFPAPNYAIPTSIPAVTFPSVPNPLTITLDAPDPVTFPALATAPAITPTQIITDFTLITGTTGISGDLPTGGNMAGTDLYSSTTGLISDGEGMLGEVLSYTSWITGQIAALESQQLTTITIDAAPSWYAPALPRAVANIGWTFEGMSDGMYTNPHRYSVTAWAGFAGYTASLPIQLGKSLWDLLAFFGPVGLFLIWLLAVMLPTVLGFNILIMLKTIMIRIVSFVLTLAGWLLKLIDYIIRMISMIIDWLWKLWEAIPFVN